LCSSSAIISAIALIALLTEADRRLKPVELEARGLDGFTRDNPSITKAVQLADWEHSAKMAWRLMAALVLAKLCNLSSLQRIFAGIRLLQKSQKVHQGRLPRPRAAADCNKLAALDQERHVGYRTNDGLSRGIVF